MRGLGILLLVLGIGAFLLPYVGLQFKLLSFVDAWGVQTGYLIKGGVAALGALLAVFGGKTG